MKKMLVWAFFSLIILLLFMSAIVYADLIPDAKIDVIASKEQGSLVAINTIDGIYPTSTSGSWCVDSNGCLSSALGVWNFSPSNMIEFAFWWGAPEPGYEFYFTSASVYYSIMIDINDYNNNWLEVPLTNDPSTGFANLPLSSERHGYCSVNNNRISGCSIVADDFFNFTLNRTNYITAIRLNVTSCTAASQQNFCMGEADFIFTDILCGKVVDYDAVITTDLAGCVGDGLIVDSNNITIDCNGHSISGVGSGSGIKIAGNNTILKNCIISGFNNGVLIADSSKNLIINNTLHNNTEGLVLTSYNDTIIGNNILKNEVGIDNNGEYTIAYHNNIYNNSIAVVSAGTQKYDNGSGGNYWSDFDESGEGCNDGNFDGICDSPYVIDGGQDNYPYICQNGWVTPCQVYEECNDDIDNDNDGYIDECFEKEMKCFDGIDDDKDGFTDTEDQDCYEYRKITLQEGWNLVASPIDKTVTISKATKSIQRCLKSIYSYEGNLWNGFSPNNPFNNLPTISPNYAYWININCSEDDWHAIVDSTCYEDLDCDDSDPCNVDFCTDTGTSNSYCTNTGCVTNTCCGTDGFVGERYCAPLGEVVYQDYAIYTCNLPSEHNSFCSDETKARFIKDCWPLDCVNGECV